jgi:hypothetical protein
VWTVGRSTFAGYPRKQYDLHLPSGIHEKRWQYIHAQASWLWGEASPPEPFPDPYTFPGPVVSWYDWDGTPLIVESSGDGEDLILALVSNAPGYLEHRADTAVDLFIGHAPGTLAILELDLLTNGVAEHIIYPGGSQIIYDLIIESFVDAELFFCGEAIGFAATIDMFTETEDILCAESFYEMRYTAPPFYRKYWKSSPEEIVEGCFMPSIWAVTFQSEDTVRQKPIGIIPSYNRRAMIVVDKPEHVVYSGGQPCVSPAVFDVFPSEPIGDTEAMRYPHGAWVGAA